MMINDTALISGPVKTEAVISKTTLNPNQGAFSVLRVFWGHEVVNMKFS